MKSVEEFHLVQLGNGVFSIRSAAHRETFHPVIGPVAEAEALYVRPLRLSERTRLCSGEFVIWDIGLGAAANALTVLRGARQAGKSLRLVSFDSTLEPLRFAWQHAPALGYFEGYEETIRELINHGHVRFVDYGHTVTWQLHMADFPSWITQGTCSKGASPVGESANTAAGLLGAELTTNSGSESIGDPVEVAPPDAILFDAYSPAKNPDMWTAPLFAAIYKRLDPNRPCALATYSRSTLLRVTLLMAGFYVGRGPATGQKEETTLAANVPGLIDELLGQEWLRRARHSTSAEPLWEPVYRQEPLSERSWKRLREHPQFLKDT
ncbi:MAG: MnmC family methyltransferase [Candidatus Omnitrophica bacterium]|nr:MnmC family methyltransferase [Candidatus Omnitrophota bacterium]